MTLRARLAPRGDFESSTQKEGLSWNCLRRSCASSCRRCTRRRTEADPIGFVKFFTPDSNWTWYATEGSEEDGDFVFFGYVCGFENEFGYFRLSELQEARGPLGLAIERDLYFEPTPLSKLRQDRC